MNERKSEVGLLCWIRCRRRLWALAPWAPPKGSQRKETNQPKEKWVNSIKSTWIEWNDGQGRNDIQWIDLDWMNAANKAKPIISFTSIVIEMLVVAALAPAEWTEFL